MQLDIQIDDAKLQAALRRFPDRMGKNLRKGVQRFATDFVADFTRSNLSAPDDRSGDFIPRRPPGSKGLVRRSGSLARSLITTTKGDKVADLETKIGFLNPFAAMVAAVHEKGKVIFGHPFLAIPVRDISAALASTVQRIVKVRKVTIPARLGFFAAADKSGPKLTASVKKAVKDTIEGKF